MTPHTKRTLFWSAFVALTLVGAGLVAYLALTPTDAGWIDVPAECGAKKWDAMEMPIAVYFGPGDEGLAMPLQRAYAQWPELSAHTRFRGFTDPFSSPPPPAIIVRLDSDYHPDDEQRLHGRTQFGWSNATDCRLLYAYISVPAEIPAHHEDLRALVLGHELGHALRLADDNLASSLMHERASTRFERHITAADRGRLASAYGALTSSVAGAR